MMERFHKIWKLILIVGILNAIVGLGVFFSLFQKNTTENIVAVMLLLSAAISAVYTVSLGQGYSRIPGILMTLLRIGTALIIFFNPLDRNITFTTLMGIFFGLDGALMVGEAREWRSRKSIYYPAMGGGITSCIFCVLIYTYMKGTPYFVVSALVGITFGIRAALLISFAIQAKNYVSPLSAAGEPAVITDSTEAPA